MIDKVHEALSEWAEGFGALYKKDELFRILPWKDGVKEERTYTFRVSTCATEGEGHVFSAVFRQFVVDSWTVRWHEDGKETGFETPTDEDGVLDLFHIFTLAMETDEPEIL